MQARSVGMEGSFHEFEMGSRDGQHPGQHGVVLVEARRECTGQIWRELSISHWLVT